MKVKLIDVDSKIPNLALMKISAWHKAQGDEVSFDVPDPNLVYISSILKKNRDQTFGIPTMYPDAEIRIGGYGINYSHLPQEIHSTKPDYDLYPSKYAQGYTTRGCIRNCPWCIVPQAEGKIYRDQHIKDFYDPRFDTIMLMDSNILADSEWFAVTADYILDHNLKVIEHGMDIRLLDESIVSLLREIKFKGMLHFAWDFIDDGIERDVMHGLNLLEAGGFNLKYEIDVYVLVG